MIRRVPKDFDWPIGVIWPGFIISEPCGSIDDIAVKYYKKKRVSLEEKCVICRKWAQLAKIPLKENKCPDLSSLREPPKGRYYQLWNTTTEGHPMSPPLKTPEELARWLVENKVSSYGYTTASYETWLEFIKGPGWAPSGAIVDGEFKPGVEL